MLRNTDKNSLQKLFPLPSQSITTRGMHVGVLIKFKTFYLKIYDDQCEDSYLIQGYRYNEQNPVFEENISVFQLREFASRFNKEDGLKKYKWSCGITPCHYNPK